MAQLHGFSLNNFRVFQEETSFDFAPITILTGPNSSGKSSLFKAMLLLQDSFKSENGLMLDFTGERHFLGDFDKARCRQNPDDESMTFTLNLGSQPWLFGLLKSGCYVQYKYEKEILNHFCVGTKNEEGEYDWLYMAYKQDDSWLAKIGYDQLIPAYNTTKKTEQPTIELENGLFLNAQKIREELASFDTANVEEFIVDLDRFYRNRLLINFYVLQNDYLFTRNTLSQNKPKDYRAYVEQNGNVLHEMIGQKLYYNENVIVENEDGTTTNYGRLSFQKQLISNDLDSNDSKKYCIQLDEYGQYNSLQEYANFLPYLKEHAVTYISSDFLLFADSLLPSLLQEEMSDLLKSIHKTLGFSYLESVKANVRRVYTLKSEGTLLNELLLNYTKKQKFEDDLYKAKSEEYIQKWLNAFKIANKLDIELLEGVIHKVNLFKDGREFILADLGYGITQLIPIILKIVTDYEFDKGLSLHTILHKKLGMESTKSVFISALYEAFHQSTFRIDNYDIESLKKAFLNFELSFDETKFQLACLAAEDEYASHLRIAPQLLLEEPEANLHPKFQSMLADFFLDTVKKFNINLLIESHSEYMIRKFQYLVAKKEVRPEDVAIYYMYPPDEVPEGRKQVERINILPNGQLDNEFGTGFFDEASNLMMSILKAQNLN
jgi:energy-coupling factor transporter ATP-binding protein EcfA2